MTLRARDPSLSFLVSLPPVWGVGVDVVVLQYGVDGLRCSTGVSDLCILFTVSVHVLNYFSGEKYARALWMLIALARSLVVAPRRTSSSTEHTPHTLSLALGPPRERQRLERAEGERRARRGRRPGGAAPRSRSMCMSQRHDGVRLFDSRVIQAPRTRRYTPLSGRDESRRVWTRLELADLIYGATKSALAFIPPKPKELHKAARGGLPPSDARPKLTWVRVRVRVRVRARARVMVRVGVGARVRVRVRVRARARARVQGRCGWG